MHILNFLTKRNKSKKDFFVNPEHYHQFRGELLSLLALDGSPKAQHLIQELESKLLDPGFSDPADVRRDRAIDKWLETEVRNGDTNTRLSLLDDSAEQLLLVTEDCRPVYMSDVLAVAHENMRYLLGDHVPWDELRGSFSGGASTSIRRGVGVIPEKYQRGSDITEDAIAAFRIMAAEAVHWYPEELSIVPGNEMFTVPKTTLIDRCAAKEPDLNMYAQKAVGDAIRRRLRRVGIDLNNQSVNQDLARQGSIDGLSATVDLSSASDSVTRQLVLRLIPENWFILMESLRSHKTLVRGTWHDNQMFSSMGNAFTFELESAIFWALSKSVAYWTSTKGRISVYGDDIIIPVGMKESFLAVFDFCGFKVNPKKSFFEGPFRESCGLHAHSGIEITPFYVKSVPKDVTDWCHLLNSLRRWCKVGRDGCLDPFYYDIWKRYSSLVPLPLHGGYDLSRKDYLCSYGSQPRARIIPKQDERRKRRDELQQGAYLHWLDISDRRRELSVSILALAGVLLWEEPELARALLRENEILESLGLTPALETNLFREDGHLKWERIPRGSQLRHDHYFPQEIMGDAE